MENIKACTMILAEQNPITSKIMLAILQRKFNNNIKVELTISGREVLDKIISNYNNYALILMGIYLFYCYIF